MQKKKKISDSCVYEARPVETDPNSIRKYKWGKFSGSVWWDSGRVGYYNIWKKKLPLKIPWSRLLYRGASSKSLWQIVNGQKHYTWDMSRSRTWITICTCITWYIARIHYQCATFLFYLIFFCTYGHLVFRNKDMLCYVMLCYVMLCYSMIVRCLEIVFWGLKTSNTGAFRSVPLGFY